MPKTVKPVKKFEFLQFSQDFIPNLGEKTFAVLQAFTEKFRTFHCR